MDLCSCIGRSFWTSSLSHVGFSTTALVGIASFACVGIMIETCKAIYDSEAVEIRCAIPLPPSLWSRTTGRMLRSDIAAKRKFINFMPTYVLYPKDRNRAKLDI